MSRKNIPSKQDFERAEAADRERNKGLSQVCEIILKRFADKGVHEVYMFYSPQTSTFGAYVFYDWKRQIEEFDESGLTSQIKEAVYDELENVGRGDRKTLLVEFEFDSHENVEANYQGDYFLRLR